jgi:CDP-glucose 4,6-dehydratase
LAEGVRCGSIWICTPPKREIVYFVTCRLNEKIHHIDGDIRDLDKLVNYFENVKPEIALHLAAQRCIRFLQRPNYTFEN